MSLLLMRIMKREKGLEADSVEHHGVKRCLFCNVLSNVTVCGARVHQDCYRPLDMPLAMDTYADITGHPDQRGKSIINGTSQCTSVGRYELWRDPRNHVVYGEAHDVRHNRSDHVFLLPTII